VLVAGLLVASQGESPGAFFRPIVNSSFGSPASLLDLLRWSNPLILSGLAFAVAFRAGVFNIGVEGQIGVGALSAAAVGRLVELPAVPLIPLCLLAGAAAGALWAWPAAWLYRRYGVNEVVTTLMLNYIAMLLCAMLVREFFLADIAGGGKSQTIATPEIREQATFPKFSGASDANASVLVTLLVIAIATVVLLRTRLGFEITAAGDNPRFARFAGISVDAVRSRAFLASGAIGGLIGAIEVQGVLHRYIDGAFTNMGFNGILVSLVGMSNPIGVIGAGLFMGVLQTSSLAISQFTNVSSYMITLISAVFILVFATNPLRQLLRRIGARRAH
jgi:simple sugar transport system permease protein